MKNENETVEVVKSPEVVVKEPIAEVLGNFTEVSRGKNGGSDGGRQECGGGAGATFTPSGSSVYVFCPSA